MQFHFEKNVKEEDGGKHKYWLFFNVSARSSNNPIKILTLSFFFYRALSRRLWTQISVILNPNGMSFKSRIMKKWIMSKKVNCIKKIKRMLIVKSREIYHWLVLYIFLIFWCNLTSRAGWCTSELQLKVNCGLQVNCRIKFGLVCKLLQTSPIFFINSLSVYNSLSAAIHLYMIRP